MYSFECSKNSLSSIVEKKIWSFLEELFKPIELKILRLPGHIDTKYLLSLSKKGTQIPPASF